MMNSDIPEKEITEGREAVGETAAEPDVTAELDAAAEDGKEPEQNLAAESGTPFGAEDVTAEIGAAAALAAAAEDVTAEIGTAAETGKEVAPQETPETAAEEEPQTAPETAAGNPSHRLLPEEDGPGIFSEDRTAPSAGAKRPAGKNAKAPAGRNGTKAREAVPAETAAGLSFFNRFFKATRETNAPLYYVREVLSWILVLGAAFVIAILINMYVIRMSNVVGDSMRETYHDGDRVFLSRLPYIFGKAERGDVIVFDSTKQEKNFAEDFKESVEFNLITQMFMKKNDVDELQHKYYIKRVIGVEGDVISVTGGELYLNGVKVGDEPYTNHEDPSGPPDYSRWEGTTWTVGKGELFVMGDNRNHSTDSRVIGVIPVGCVLGKVLR